MPRTKKVSWSDWDKQLEQLGMLLLVGSIGALGLPAIPGVISLCALLLLYTNTRNIRPSVEIIRFAELKNKPNKSKEEEIELSKYEAGEHPPKRNVAAYYIGFSFWGMSLIYLGLFKGLLLGNWI